MWLINRSFGNIKNFWSRAARTREFNEGTSIKVSDYTHAPFKNNYEKLVAMFQLRLYHVNNTPYQFQSDIYTNELTNLHKELNFLQGRLFMKRLLLVFGILNVYIFFFMEQDSKDWGDKFDLKFMKTLYGEVQESTADGTESLDE